MSKQNKFKEFERFDYFEVAEALYIWLSDWHKGQWSDEYAALCELTEPGLFKPRPSLKGSTLDETSKEVYSMLNKNNYRVALEYVKS